MIRGIHNGASVTVKDYSESELDSIIHDHFTSR